jgi:adenylate kinase
MLECATAVIGSPAAGKTTLTIRTGARPDCCVFRLGEHVPADILATTTGSPDRLASVDNFTVFSSVHAYIESVMRGGDIHTLLLDGFPGTGTQVSLFMAVLRQVAPHCAVSAIELIADPLVLRSRADARLACERCERGPAYEPLLPATLGVADPQRCSRCHRLLKHCRGAPAARIPLSQRYAQVAQGIHQAFALAGVPVIQLDTSRALDESAREFSALLAFSGESRHVS